MSARAEGQHGPSGPVEDEVVEPALGVRIRAFRQLRQLSVRGLAAEVGASPGFLSQLERGQANASVAMLRRIAGALGLTIADLFDERESVGPRVLRRAERAALPTAALARKYLISRQPLRSIEAYVGEFEPGGAPATSPTRTANPGSSSS
jgi:transcriptional regulator with XRE-family HTH domain